MKKRIKKFSVLLPMILVILSGQTLYCAALSVSPEDAAPRTLEVELMYGDESGQTPVSGARIQVSRVADLIKEKGNYQYRLTDEYSLSGIEINSMKTASESIDAAKALNDMRRKEQLPYETGTTDSQGKAVFSFDEPGMYLVSQSGWNGSDIRYTEFTPYLVKLPMPDSDDQANITAWENNVVTEPKLGIGKASQETKPPAPSVKTGDDMNIYLPLAFMAAGLLIFIAVQSRRKNENR